MRHGLLGAIPSLFGIKWLVESLGLLGAMGTVYQARLLSA